MKLNYTLIRGSMARQLGGLRREEADRLLERGARVAGKVSNSPPRVQSPSKVSVRGYVLYIHLHPAATNPADRGRPRREASLSWQATRKSSLRCEIFNLFSCFFIQQNVIPDFTTKLQCNAVLNLLP